MDFKEICEGSSILCSGSREGICFVDLSDNLTLYLASVAGGEYSRVL